MLTITERQFAKMGETSFVGRLRRILFESFPDEVRGIPVAQLDAEIIRQARCAEAYGLKSEVSAAVFVSTAWILGPGFEARFEDVQRTLKSTWLTEAQKSTWLQSYCVELLKVLAN
jgi:hypothetical protein